MSNLGSGLFPQQLVVPSQARGPQRLLGEFPTYAGAEQLVDQLSDKGFAVEHCRIVGSGLRSVEYVTGRLNRAQAAVAGASSGAWFGLLIGLLLGMFSDSSSWLAVVLVSTGLGAAWMATLGFVAHWATGGRRDFAGVQSLEADSYAVYVDADHADEAVRAAGLF
jgi:hypothetical protein